MYEEYGINQNLEKLALEVEEEVKEELKKVDIICEKNSIKVLKAFQENALSDIHFGMTTGYGYGDIGRDVIEKIYAQIFKAEDALVRSQFISGTHALTVALFSLLRPGDTMLSINGKPYDTLDEVIGIVENQSSLKAYGINYRQIDLVNNDFNDEEIQETLKREKIKLIEIQRSRGYANRKSLTLDKVERVIKKIREVDQDVIIMIDNCYCEFVGEKEPIEVGADIAVGSLIKNLGGGIAPNGAYIVGKKELVELAGERLTAPGEGKEVGPTLGMNKSILQGLFFAPSVVASSLKTAIFTSKILEKMGYQLDPKYNEERADIVQTIAFGNEKDLVKYCQGIQMGSPVDSNSIPEAWDMPGYTDKVIMAAGSFTQGSSIELSCDGPIRPPYIAFQQGGLTYPYGKLGVLKAIQNMTN
ncbi:MAG TPA: methionine gamma-lyase family protein [Candidatus Merdicola faecigallinarum]|uniref:Methionine gamma-lyase family protein n=1 Tax=Candidatus Merdicola faecigallinarum TaxID=2840862 RepID=A0A9D1M129_9FIRM|nr:methionine gamma-lyase family protein [Candidatus Merdicola faecigallinarum]